MKRLYAGVLSAFLLVSLLIALTGHRTSGRADEVLSSEPIAEACLDGTDRVTRFLVLGTDRAARLTDSIFVVALNETQKNLRILQIPRDTYAAYTERTYKKLNGACNALGETEIKQWMSAALGVPIDYFVILDLSCFRSVVDAIGGVDLDIPQEMYYSDPAQKLEINLPSGMTHLDGKTAEEFVRFRSGYVNADLGRLDAQKLFLQAFAKKCNALSAAQMLHVTACALTKLQTDIGLPEAIRTASVLRECNTEQLPMATLAGQAVQGESGAWYYAVNREGAIRMVNEYLMPAQPWNPESFDSKCVFDRMENKKFHKIYVAPEKDLPVV